MRTLLPCSTTSLCLPVPRGHQGREGHSGPVLPSPWALAGGTCLSTGRRRQATAGSGFSRPPADPSLQPLRGRPLRGGPGRPSLLPYTLSVLWGDLPGHPTHFLFSGKVQLRLPCRASEDSATQLTWTRDSAHRSFLLQRAGAPKCRLPGCPPSGCVGWEPGLR